MENHKFNWLSDEAPVETPNSKEQAPKIPPKEKVLLLVKEYKGPIIFALILFILSLASPSQSETKQKSYKPAATIAALVSMWPIAKGEEVNISHFKAIRIKATNLTKNQQLQLFDTVGVDTQRGEQLVAKKDIPPNKPIFWSDLSIQKKKVSHSKKTQIHYGSNQGAAK